MRPSDGHTYVSPRVIVSLQVWKKHKQSLYLPVRCRKVVLQWHWPNTPQLIVQGLFAFAAMMLFLDWDLPSGHKLSLKTPLHQTLNRLNFVRPQVRAIETNLRAVIDKKKPNIEKCADTWSAYFGCSALPACTHLRCSAFVDWEGGDCWLGKPAVAVVLSADARVDELAHYASGETSAVATANQI